VELARVESLRGVAAGGFIPAEEADPDDDDDFKEPVAKRARVGVTATSADSVGFHLPGKGRLFNELCTGTGTVVHSVSYRIPLCYRIPVFSRDKK
jgi:hypothetical protein